MKKFIVITLLFFLIHIDCLANTTSSHKKLITHSKQLIIVFTTHWDAKNGQLQRFARDSTRNPWQPIGKSIAVVIGKNGLAWDYEYSTAVKQNDISPIKKEGDGRTPIGIYKMGLTFGFDKTSHMTHYFPLTETSVCVDDPQSIYYNQLIDSRHVTQLDWNSGEKMRTIPQYKIGAMVLYNTPPKSGAGSCIFLHIWKGSYSGTAGCIAMEEFNLREVLNWLDTKKNPVIAVLPLSIYPLIKTQWRLPDRL